MGSRVRKLSGISAIRVGRQSEHLAAYSFFNTDGGEPFDVVDFAHSLRDSGPGSRGNFDASAPASLPSVAAPTAAFGSSL